MVEADMSDLREELERSGQEQLRARYRWREVETPTMWRPRDGEEVIGYYGGKSCREGVYGSYEVAVLHVPARGAVLLTGVKLINLFDSASIQVGDPVRVIFVGARKISEDRTMKDYKVFLVDSRPVDPESLPRVEDLDDRQETSSYR